MIKYFTKEYIKECDCEEIQRLRKKLKWEEDWYDYMKDAYFHNNEFFNPNKVRSQCIYLPTGDQLDEEIEKICKDKKLYYGEMYFGDESSNSSFSYLADVSTPAGYTGKSIDIIEQNNNPYIAKIKLLKELLKE